MILLTHKLLRQQLNNNQIPKITIEKKAVKSLIQSMGSSASTMISGKVIDTPEFQRLREIKQLGALYFVFPSAVHSRFEHCIGTAYLCQMYMDKLIENNPEEYPLPDIAKESRIEVTLAGLLHDIGHGPFSHMFDNEFMGNHRSSEEKA